MGVIVRRDEGNESDADAVGRSPRGCSDTSCAPRLQTLDGGAPASAYTVAKELGYGGDGAAVAEYRVEQHRAKLKDR
jgi:hypothetical protein